MTFIRFLLIIININKKGRIYMKIEVKNVVKSYGRFSDTIVVNNAQCKVCGKKFQYHRYTDGQRMKEVGICYNCDFWMEKFTMRDERKVARIDGNHYVIGKEIEVELDPGKSFNDIISDLEKNNSKKSGMGMGGAVCAIQFYDGRVVFTNDLWGQGTIPKRFKHILVNNAEFIERAE